MAYTRYSEGWCNAFELPNESLERGFGLPQLKIAGEIARFDEGDDQPARWKERYIARQKRLARRRELYRLRKAKR